MANTQIVMVPSPGIGHLIPFVELAKRLVSHHSLVITFLIPTMPSVPVEAQKSLFQTLPPSISYVFLPPADMDGISLQTVMIETLIVQAIQRSLHSMREELRLREASGCKFAAVVADFFAVDCFEVANEFGAAPYLFFVSGATTLATLLYLPKLDEMFDCDLRELDHPVQIPGCKPIPGEEMEPIQTRKKDAYQSMLNLSKLYSLANGIMVNTFLGLENGPIRAMQDPESGYPPVYAVGPLIRMDSMVHRNESECLEWLNHQPESSVLFVSFGSAGTLTHEQTTEVAMGLEMSEQRFLWVVKSPNESRVHSAYFRCDNETDPFYFLPDGFLHRTKGRGLIVDSWAPQTKILGHRATGGFLTHCGWNSTLEGMVSGVPFIGWPLFAEQKMNAFHLSQDVGVALRLRRSSETGLIRREEISTVVRSLMAGDTGEIVRKRMTLIQSAACEALAKGGSSDRSLAEVVARWTCQ